jgi:glycosyl transferase family 25
MLPMPSHIPIYVLNVKKFTKRRKFMEQQLIEHGLVAEFIFDWDIEDLDAQAVSRYFSNDNLSPAQQSCAMKHVCALQKIAANNSMFNVVLEDDAVFANNFNTGIKHVLEQSEQFPGDKVIFIGSGGNFFTPKSQRKPGQYLYRGDRGRFTDSYIIASSTAQKRLEWIDSHKISKPIDNQFDIMDRELDIKILWLEDPVVEQGSKNGLFASAIESAPPQRIQSLLFAFEKLKRKYIYQLWR